MDPILAFQQQLETEYLGTIEYHVSYIDGTPLRPVIPKVTNTGGIMIVGAYPTAKFATIDGIQNIPVGDIEVPFSTETYSDGGKERDVRAGVELREKYLERLGLTESDLWITNLVKVFLFKPGHVLKYKHFDVKIQETRSRFKSIAEHSLVFLETEISLAQPKAFILLGEEVSKFLVEVKGPGQRLFDGKLHELKGINTTAKAFCLPHPGIVMRPKRKKEPGKPAPTDWNKKLEVLLPEIKKWIRPND